MSCAAKVLMQFIMSFNALEKVFMTALRNTINFVSQTFYHFIYIAVTRTA